MPRGSLTKIDAVSKIYNLKTRLYNCEYRDWEKKQYDSAHHVLNEVLNFLQEYSR